MPPRLFTNGFSPTVFVSGWLNQFNFFLDRSFFSLYSNVSSEEMLYSEADLIASMPRIETINFHQEIEVNGIKFWCYHAGHVLGAAMIMIEIAGVKVREEKTHRIVFSFFAIDLVYG